MSASEYTLQAQKGIKESFDNGAQVAIEKYMKLPIFNVQGDDEWANICTTTEGFTGMRETAEHETPEVNTLGDGYSVQIENKRFTNAYEITSSDRQKMKDSTTMVDRFLIRKRDKALRESKVFFVKSLMDFFNNGFDTTLYAAPDTKALYADDHTWKSGETFDNKGTAAFSEAALTAALQDGSAIKDGGGEEMDVEYNTIVVRKNSDAHVAAQKLFAHGITPTAVGDVNIYEGSMTIIALPYISIANKAYWFLFDTTMPDENPLYAGVGAFPHFTAPITQNNEAIRQNIEGFWKQGIVNMPYMTWGSNGTT